MNRFRFKTFEVEHHRSTMKVGTDAVLLGAWVELDGAANALDIGTGCGVISLILASRSTSLTITAIDIDSDSTEETRLNFASSKWEHRLMVYNQSLQCFALSPIKKFDLIVSNPPWFINSLRVPGNTRRNNARHNDSLNFPDLIDGSLKLLNDNGRAVFILPSAEGNIFEELAHQKGLYLTRKCLIKSDPKKAPHRWLLEFRLQHPDAVTITELYVHNEDGSFSEAYKTLTGDFYLNFQTR